MSTAAFRKNFSKLLQKAGENAEAITRKVALDMMGAMILKSPVDTGRFRANWNMSINSMDASNDAPESRDALVVGASVLPNFRAGGKIFITNSLPYAMRLEYGWSQQAPGGMVRTTVDEYGQHLKRAVEGMRR